MLLQSNLSVCSQADCKDHVDFVAKKSLLAHFLASYTTNDLTYGEQGHAGPQERSWQNLIGGAGSDAFSGSDGVNTAS